MKDLSRGARCHLLGGLERCCMPLAVLRVSPLDLPLQRKSSVLRALRALALLPLGALVPMDTTVTWIFPRASGVSIAPRRGRRHVGSR